MDLRKTELANRINQFRVIDNTLDHVMGFVIVIRANLLKLIGIRGGHLVSYPVYG